MKFLQYFNSKGGDWSRFCHKDPKGEEVHLSVQSEEESLQALIQDARGLMKKGRELQGELKEVLDRMEARLEQHVAPHPQAQEVVEQLKAEMAEPLEKPKAKTEDAEIVDRVFAYLTQKLKKDTLQKLVGENQEPFHAFASGDGGITVQSAEGGNTLIWPKLPQHQERNRETFTPEGRQALAQKLNQWWAEQSQPQGEVKEAEEVGIEEEKAVQVAAKQEEVPAPEVIQTVEPAVREGERGALTREVAVQMLEGKEGNLTSEQTKALAPSLSTEETQTILDEAKKAAQQYRAGYAELLKPLKDSKPKDKNIALYILSCAEKANATPNSQNQGYTLQTQNEGLVLCPKDGSCVTLCEPQDPTWTQYLSSSSYTEAQEVLGILSGMWNPQKEQKVPAETTNDTQILEKVHTEDLSERTQEVARIIQKIVISEKLDFAQAPFMPFMSSGGGKLLMQYGNTLMNLSSMSPVVSKLWGSMKPKVQDRALKELNQWWATNYNPEGTRKAVEPLAENKDL